MSAAAMFDAALDWQLSAARCAILDLAREWGEFTAVDVIRHSDPRLSNYVITAMLRRLEREGSIEVFYPKPRCHCPSHRPVRAFRAVTS